MAEIIQIDSHTWRFEDGFVRYFLLEGEEKAVMIDSGVNSPDALSIAQTLTDKPIMLMNTHGDGDHTSGTSSWTEIYMHESDYINCEVGARYPETALKKLEDGDEIDLGSRPIKVIHIPGHTMGSLAFVDINARVLYAGDSVQTESIYMFGNKRVPDQFEESLDKLIAANNMYDKIYASHGEYCIPKDYAQKVKESWIQVRSGNVEYEMVDLFGMKVKSYTTDVCGFYME